MTGRLEHPPSPDDHMVAVPLGLLRLFGLLWDEQHRTSGRLNLQLLLEVVDVDLVQGHLFLRVKAIRDLEDTDGDHLGTI